MNEVFKTIYFLKLKSEYKYSTNWVNYSKVNKILNYYQNIPIKYHLK
jgi:hypothetical protein